MAKDDAWARGGHAAANSRGIFEARCARESYRITERERKSSSRGRIRSGGIQTMPMVDLAAERVPAGGAKGAKFARKSLNEVITMPELALHVDEAEGWPINSPAAAATRSRLFSAS